MSEHQNGAYTCKMNETVHFVESAQPVAASGPKEVGRTNDPARTMAEILTVATHEFADKGLTGARIDEIAAATRTSKRMIYYYLSLIHISDPRDTERSRMPSSA